MVMRKGDRDPFGILYQEKNIEQKLHLRSEEPQLKFGRGCVKVWEGKRNCFTNKVSLASRNKLVYMLLHICVDLQDVFCLSLRLFCLFCWYAEAQCHFNIYAVNRLLLPQPLLIVVT
jgi:hypothetical protein